MSRKSLDPQWAMFIYRCNGSLSLSLVSTVVSSPAGPLDPGVGSRGGVKGESRGVVGVEGCCARSSSHLRPRLMAPRYSTQIRWLVAYKRVFEGHSHQRVSNDLHVSKHFQTDVLTRFNMTGDVTDAHQPPSCRRVMSHEMDASLLRSVLASPRLRLRDHSLRLELSHGVRVSVPTLCRAMRRLLLSKQALQHIALRLDEDQARSFWHQLVTRYRYDQILVADETSKNIGVLHSVRGWGQMGITPTDRDTTHTRAQCLRSHVLLSARLRGLAVHQWYFRQACLPVRHGPNAPLTRSGQQRDPC